MSQPEEQEEVYESQQSMAIPAGGEETSANPASEVQEGGHEEKKHGGGGKHKYSKRVVSARMTLLKPYKFNNTYETGKKAGQKFRLSRQTRQKRLHKYGIGRAAVGTCVVRTRVMRGLKEIRDANLKEVAFLLKKGADTRVVFQGGAIDEAVRAGDLFLHERFSDAKQAALNKFGEVHTISEYDVRRAWNIAAQGRHLADMPYIAADGANPTHKKRPRVAKDAEEAA
jgi:hypothetical protein